MNKKMFFGVLVSGMILTGCGQQEGKDALEGKIFTAEQGNENDFTYEFKDDHVVVVKATDGSNRTDEGEYTVSDKKNKKGYYEVKFSKLDSAMGYTSKPGNPDEVWLLDKDKSGNNVLRYYYKVYDDIRDNSNNKGKLYIPSKEKVPGNEITDKFDVYLKERK